MLGAGAAIFTSSASTTGVGEALAIGNSIFSTTGTAVGTGTLTGLAAAVWSVVASSAGVASVEADSSFILPNLDKSPLFLCNISRLMNPGG